jgi:ADP-heptose:LPS heptosyltransferase
MSSGLHRFRRRVRGAALDWAARAAPAGDAPLPDLGALERVLLVLLNFRLGNTVLATPGVAAVAKAMPKAELDFLGGPAAGAVMQGHRLRRVWSLSRGEVLRPVRLARLVSALRRERYQAAVHLSPATSSLGAFLVAASGAPHRIGCLRARGNVYFTSTVPRPAARHKVDQMARYLSQIGVDCDGERALVLSADELAWAESRLAGEPTGRARVAMFVGARARKGKAWPLETASAVAAHLRSDGLRPIVFLGPEEEPRRPEIQAALAPAQFVSETDLRRVAALLSCCAVVVTPDAGPMHLAVAAGVPTVAIFRSSEGDKWGPRPPRGVSLHDPGGREVQRVLVALREAVGATAGR